MRRKMYDELVRWKRDPDRKAALVHGCGQVGKTYTVSEFAENNYDRSLFIDLERDEVAMRIFEGPNLSAEGILDRLSSTKNVDFSDDMVLILDGIQHSQGAYSALKPLGNSRICDVIATCTFPVTEAGRNRLSPMGYVDFKEMHPMDFEEFLWAVGWTMGETDMVRTHIENGTDLEPAMYDRAAEEFGRYVLTGGFPETVATYRETRNVDYTIPKTRGTLETVLNNLERHTPAIDTARMRRCLERMVEESIADVPDWKSVDDVYGEELHILEESGLVSYSYGLTQPESPLKTRMMMDSFEMHLMDSGLVSSLMGADVRERFMKGVRDRECKHCRGMS
jgi:predicted AAA+ superfamily ATPase